MKTFTTQAVLQYFSVAQNSLPSFTMKFSASFAALALALSASASPFKRDAATVESDIASISSQVTTLNNAITQFGTSKSLTDALVSPAAL